MIEGPWFVFDVESNGLHGEGFAVGFVVVDNSGARLDSGCYVADIDPDTVSDWVGEHVLHALPPPTHKTVVEMRTAFWADWMRWKQLGAEMVADCGWPVETGFLAACIKDEWSRDGEGPCPLHDVSTALLMAGRDPFGEYDRLEDELPRHNPLADAIQSARLWLQVCRSPKLTQSRTGLDQC